MSRAASCVPESNSSSSSEREVVRHGGAGGGPAEELVEAVINKLAIGGGAAASAEGVATIAERNEALWTFLKALPNKELENARKQFLDVIGKPTADQRAKYLEGQQADLTRYLTAVVRFVDMIIEKALFCMQAEVHSVVAPADIAGAILKEKVDGGEIYTSPTAYLQSGVPLTREQELILANDERVLKFLGLTTHVKAGVAAFFNLVVTKKLYEELRKSYAFLPELVYTKELFKTPTGVWYPYTRMPDQTKEEKDVGIPAHFGSARKITNAVAGKLTGLPAAQAKFAELKTNPKLEADYIMRTTSMLRIIDTTANIAA